MRVPTSVLAALALYLGLEGELFDGWAPKMCEVARISGCYDGDTCAAFIEGRHESVRLDGFDTPELGQKAGCLKEQRLGLAARDRLRVLIAHAPDRQFCTSGSSFDRDRYNRVLATLELGGRDVADILIEEGHAVPYSGGWKTHDWCL